MINYNKQREVKKLAKCIIFCAGEFDGLVQPIAVGDLVIAADGGLQHTQKLGLKPDVILGDFDSLGYTPEGANVFPVEKDDTDAMLAVRLGLNRGFREFLLYGSLDGPRLDHTVANFQTLQFLADHGACGCLVGNTTLVSLVKNGSLHFPETAEGTLSVFCNGPDAVGVTLEGLYYPLQNGTMTAGFPLGASNHFTGKQASITVEDGSLLVIWQKNAGLPLEFRM